MFSCPVVSLQVPKKHVPNPSKHHARKRKKHRHASTHRSSVHARPRSVPGDIRPVYMYRRPKKSPMWDVGYIVLQSVPAPPPNVWDPTNSFPLLCTPARAPESSPRPRPPRPRPLFLKHPTPATPSPPPRPQGWGSHISTGFSQGVPRNPCTPTVSETPHNHRAHAPQRYPYYQVTLWVPIDGGFVRKTGTAVRAVAAGTA